MMLRQTTLSATISLVLAGLATQAGAAQGPSSSATPYLAGIRAGVDFTSILTVGDAVPTGYRMAGIPDGLGAYDNGDGTFTVLISHEISRGGAVRAHGYDGAFVSNWTVRKSDLGVTAGRDLITQAYLWNGSAYTTSSGSWGSPSFSRFCSADLAPITGLYDSKSGLGTNARLFLHGEEAGATGRAFVTVATGADAGKTYQFYKLGNNAYENVLVSPTQQVKTVAIGNSDGGDSGLRVYVGNKTNTGTDIERAGLTNGMSYGVKVAAGNETRDTPLAGRFELVDTASNSTFLRPEDGAWDTKNPNRYFFVTTDRYDQTKDGVGAQQGRSRLYAMTFADIARPELGGTIEALSAEDGPQQMWDNITVNADGRIVLQEDVGNQKHNGKIWQFDPTTRDLVLLAGHDVARFGDLGIDPTAPFTSDEESSGVIEVTGLFTGVDGYDTLHNRYYLLDVQAHYGLPSPLMEDGQLLLMTTPVPEPQTYALLLAGLAATAFVVRRRFRE